MKFKTLNIDSTKTAKKTNEIILVIGEKFYFFIKEKNKWKKKIETKCFYGKNGFSSNRKSGDYTTPIGSFPILYAFGTEKNVKTKIEYREITNNSYFSDDESNLEEYNTWIESKYPIIGEHLKDYPDEYALGLVVGFNINPKIKGKGSSIFIHCNGKKKYTAGCIAIEKQIMLNLIEKIGKKVYIIIVPNKDYILHY